MEKYLLVIGKTPQLSLLELARVLERDFAEIENKFTVIADHVVLLEIDKDFNIEILQNRLGGVVKVARLLLESPSLQTQALLSELFKSPEEKIIFGFSLYETNLEKKVKQFEKIGLEMKKALKEKGKKARFVTSKKPDLSSVIAQKEILNKNGYDFVVVKTEKNYLIGLTKTVQDFKTYSQLDYGRPRRDAFSGMLPPKVARMMVNIASPQKGETILDPFCGSGTVLQEAGLLGHGHLIGTDVSPKAVLDSRSNLEWLREQFPRALKSTVFSFKTADALKISEEIKPASVDVIVTEVYLGPVKGKIEINKQKAELKNLYRQTFAEFKKILKSGSRLAVAFPAWNSARHLIRLEIQPDLKKLGYKFFAEPVLYGREDAEVLRDIYFMEYK